MELGWSPGQNSARCPHGAIGWLLPSTAMLLVGAGLWDEPEDGLPLQPALPPAFFYRSPLLPCNFMAKRG